MSQFRIIDTPQKALLGEGPLWSPSRQALYWVDILAPALHRMDLATEVVESWPFDEPIGWAIERAGRDDMIVGLKSGFARLSLDPFTVEPIGDPEPDRPHNRLNDAKVDPAGRIWAGSKDDRDNRGQRRALPPRRRSPLVTAGRRLSGGERPGLQCRRADALSYG